MRFSYRSTKCQNILFLFNRRFFQFYLVFWLNRVKALHKICFRHPILSNRYNFINHSLARSLVHQQLFTSAHTKSHVLMGPVSEATKVEKTIHNHKSLCLYSPFSPSLLNYQNPLTSKHIFRVESLNDGSYLWASFLFFLERMKWFISQQSLLKCTINMAIIFIEKRLKCLLQAYLIWCISVSQLTYSKAQ